MTTPWDPGAMPSDPEDIPPGPEPDPTPWQDTGETPTAWEDDTPAAAASAAAVVGERGGPVDLERLAGDVAQLLDEFTPEGVIGQHEAVLSDLTAALEQLLKTPPKSKPSPFSWAHVTGQARAQLWQDLAAWIDQHNTRFGQADSALHLTACWYRHPVVVEELTALMEAWRAAYLGHQAPTTDAIYYLQTFFHPTMHRIHTAAWGLKNCTGGHREPTLYPSPNTFDADAYDRHVASDLATHPDPPPQARTPEGDEPK